MAQVRIKLTPLTRVILDDLPPVCAECGEQTRFFTHHRFLWFPGRYFFLRPLTISPIQPPTLKAATFQDVEVPFCEWHRKHWYRRLWGLLYVGVMLFLISVFGVLTDPTAPIGMFSPLGRLGLEWLPSAVLPFVVLGWLVWWVWYNFTAIRATHISAQEITLANVSPTFAALIETEYNTGRHATTH